METFYLMDSKTKERAKAAKTFSIVAIVAAGIYTVEGIFSVIFSFIPIPIIGFFISVALTVVEFCLLVGTVIFICCALVKTIKLRKELSNVADCEESQRAMSDLRLASILSYIAIGITAVAFCVLSVLNVIELFFSVI